MTPTSKSAGECVAEAGGGTPLPIGARLGDFEVTGIIHEGESSVVYVAVDRSSVGEVAIKEYLPARLVERLANGNPGAVYVAADRSLMSEVAIKEYLPAKLAERMANGNVSVRSLRHEQAFRDGLQRFLSEARMFAALDEPALIEVLRSWEQNGTAYMAMPLYEGRTLKDVLRDSPKPREAWLKTMFGPLLDALATLHRSGRCPCDVTPDDIAVLTDGAPLFIGSGAAPRIVSTTDDVTGVLNAGFVAIERYAYDPLMPEGPWTDIYAVAAVLHLAITGKPPPAPTTRMVADTMPPMSEVTSDYSKLFLDALDRGLAVRPTHRPQTIEEFRAALGIPSMASDAVPMRHATSPPSPVPEPRLPSPSSTGYRMGGWPSTLVMSLIVVGLVGLGLLVWTLGAPRQVASGTTDRASSMTLAPESAQSSSLAATSALLTQTATRPMVPGEAPPRLEVSTQVVAPTPQNHPSLAKPTTTAAPRTGKIQFSVKPWGHIMVDGKTRGVSPPIKELSIPEGRHRIEIRNSTFPGYSSEVNIKAGSRVSIAYSFESP